MTNKGSSDLYHEFILKKSISEGELFKAKKGTPSKKEYVVNDVIVLNPRKKQLETLERISCEDKIIVYCKIALNAGSNRHIDNGKTTFLMRIDDLLEFQLQYPWKKETVIWLGTQYNWYKIHVCKNTILLCFYN